jgi:uncharacterized protein YbjQ (UPF0145 family)
MSQPYQQQRFPILLSTMNDVPGYRVVRVFGEVFGLTVRSRNMFSNMGAGFKSLAGGELKGLSKLLSDSRHEALGRLAHEIANTASEIAAYGTAVYLVPENADGQQTVAQQQAMQQAQVYQQPQGQ